MHWSISVPVAQTPPWQNRATGKLEVACCVLSECDMAVAAGGACVVAAAWTCWPACGCFCDAGMYMSMMVRFALP